MADRSGIQWTDATWNPIRGCSRVSAGCQHCYAEVVAARFSGPGQAYEGLARRRSNGEAQWTGDVMVVEKHMLDPIRWRRPRRIFVNSMSDLFHEKVRVETLDEIFAVMALAPQHTFQILTKRPDRMRRYLSGEEGGRDVWQDTARHGIALSALGITLDNHKRNPTLGSGLISDDYGLKVWPLPNVWLGVSVEDQRAADERIPLLLDTPAAIRFLSCEPLLGPVDLTRVVRQQHVGGLAVGDVHDSLGGGVWDSRGEPISCAPDMDRIAWVIVGGESGSGARSFDLAWARDLVARCANAKVPCFVKQLGANPVDPWADTGALVNDREPAKPRFKDSHGGDMAEWPEDLRVRQFPEAVTA